VTRVRADDDVTEANPVVFKQPFDLWPIRVVSSVTGGYELAAEAFPFALAEPSTTMHPPITAEATASIPRRVEIEREHTFFVPVPRDGKFRVTIAPRPEGGEAGPSAATTIEGPGTYLFDGTGLRRAPAD
jgi:hypothetical protein